MFFHRTRTYRRLRHLHVVDPLGGSPAKTPSDPAYAGPTFPAPPEADREGTKTPPKKQRTPRTTRRPQKLLPIAYCLLPLFPYSHSIVAGGLLEMSYTTRFTPRTSLMIRVEIRANTSNGIRAQSAVMKSCVSTARSATARS